MSDIPESNIGREYKSLTLGELFERNKFGEPIRFDSRYDRTHGILEYRIPEHQRHPKWSLVKKQKLLDSVFRNYTMSGFVTTEHFDIQQNKKFYDFEDGQTRLSILQDYYNNVFEYNTLYYSDLDDTEKNRFDRYKIYIEVLTNVNHDDVQIMFERLQEGKPLADEDKYWNRKTKKLVKYSHKLLTTDNDIINKEYMTTKGYGDKRRRRLGDLCGFISGIINGQNYITTCFAMQCLGRVGDRQDYPNGLLDFEPSYDHKIQIKNFFEFYYKLIDNVYHELPLRDTADTHPIWSYLQNEHSKSGIFKKKEQMKKWYSLVSSEGGMILWDYLEKNDETIDQKIDMWVEIINIGRTFKDFITGGKTIYNGLSSANKQNTSSENYRARISRIKEFYKSEDRDTYCFEKGINWNSNLQNL